MTNRAPVLTRRTSQERQKAQEAKHSESLVRESNLCDLFDQVEEKNQDYILKYYK